jgi:hypothetical protein
METRSRRRARKHITLREQLAAALAMLLRQDERNELRAAQVPAKKLIGLFEFHHDIFHALGGADRWFNLTPMLRAAHRARSGPDASTIAKVKRLAREHEEFRRKVLARSPGDKRQPSGRWPQGRKLQSRGFQRRERP